MKHIVQTFFCILVCSLSFSASAEIYHQNSSLLGPGTKGYAETGDQFGFTQVTADFNNDGYDDLAVGLPFEDIRRNSVNYADAGAVNIIYGSINGLDYQGDQLFYQDSIGIDISETNDNFGYALAAGDFNADQYMDLAIGVPGESIISNGQEIINAGMVIVLFGSTGGLVGGGDITFTQDNPNTGGQVGIDNRFGSALAVGYLQQMATTPLLTKPHDLIVGATGYSNANTDEAGGSVNIFYGSPESRRHPLYAPTIGPNFWTMKDFYVSSAVYQLDLNDDLVQPLEFGFSLAAGYFNEASDPSNIDGSSRMNLIIGLPGHIADENTFDSYCRCFPDGAILILDPVENSTFGAVGAGDANYSGTWLQPKSEFPNHPHYTAGIAFLSGGPNYATSRRFGHAIAVGNFNNDGYDEIAVGAPGVADTLDFQQISTSSGTSDGNYFGNYGDVTVISNDTVTILPGFHARTSWHYQGNFHDERPFYWDTNFWYHDIYDGLAGAAEPGDRFGYSLAVGDLMGNPYGTLDLVIGVPGEGRELGPANDHDTELDFGVANVAFGSPWGLLDHALGYSNASEGIVFQGKDPGSPLPNQMGSQFGKSLAIGDFDGDGVGDLSVGLPDYDIGSRTKAGLIHVFYGHERIFD